jgi:hypothetical protein
MDPEGLRMLEIIRLATPEKQPEWEGGGYE